MPSCRSLIATVAMLFFACGTQIAASETAPDDGCTVSDNKGVSWSCDLIIQKNGAPNKDRAIAYAVRGRYFKKQGDYDRAVADFKTALEMDPRSAFAHVEFGSYYDDRGDCDSAIDEYTRALRIEPRNYTAYVNRGICYGKSGDYRKSIIDYTRAIALNRSSASGFANRGVDLFKS